MASQADERESRVWESVGRQLGNPRGLGGALVGRLMRVANRRATRLAVEALELASCHRVLDLGCGPGSAIRLIARQLSCGIVHGLDHSPVMLAQARRSNRRCVREGKVVLADGRFESLPYPDRHFDRILASNVAYFWADLPTVLGELRRVLRAHGLIVLYVTHAESMQAWPFAGRATHRHFDEASLRAALEQAGLGSLRLDIETVRPGLGVRGLIATLSDFR